MEIRIVLSDIDYAKLVLKYLPLFRDKLHNSDSSAGKLLSTLAILPPALIVGAVNALPQEAKDDLACFLLQQNKEALLALAQDYLQQQDLGITISGLDIS